MKLCLTPKDVESFKNFENAVKKQIGPQTYVHPSYMVVMIEYPEVLKNMLRPFPKEEQWEFEF